MATISWQSTTHPRFLFATQGPGLPVEGAGNKDMSGRWHPGTFPSPGKLCHNPAPSLVSLLPPWAHPHHPCTGCTWIHTQSERKVMHTDVGLHKLLWYITQCTYLESIMIIVNAHSHSLTHHLFEVNALSNKFFLRQRVTGF